ncbi:MAG: bacteriohemerythrin [Candidatus Zixiibacteriota bacterium]
MAFFSWSDQMSVGNMQMDTQHKRLFDLINQLYDAMKAGKGKEVAGKIVSELHKYTVTHFRDEEKMLAGINYPKLNEQKSSHKKFTDKVAQFQKDLEGGKMTVNVEMMSFLKDWLVNHIQKMDKEYSQVQV